MLTIAQQNQKVKRIFVGDITVVVERMEARVNLNINVQFAINTAMVHTFAERLMEAVDTITLITGMMIIKMVQGATIKGLGTTTPITIIYKKGNMKIKKETIIIITKNKQCL